MASGKHHSRSPIAIHMGSISTFVDTDRGVWHARLTSQSRQTMRSSQHPKVLLLCGVSADTHPLTSEGPEERAAVRAATAIVEFLQSRARQGQIQKNLHIDQQLRRNLHWLYQGEFPHKATQAVLPSVGCVAFPGPPFPPPGLRLLSPPVGFPCPLPEEPPDGAVSPSFFAASSSTFHSFKYEAANPSSAECDRPCWKPPLGGRGSASPVNSQGAFHAPFCCTLCSIDFMY
eukprot:1951854-Amphidinium_carterae.1